MSKSRRKKVVESDDSLMSALFVAAKRPTSDDLQLFLATNVKSDILMSIDSKTGDSAMHMATRLGLLDNVELLINSGVDINLLNNSGDTGLHIAVLKGDCSLAKLFLNYGADPLICNALSNSTLHVAASCGHFFMVKLLLSNPRTEILQANGDGLLAVHLSAAAGHTDIVKLLCSKNLNCANYSSEPTGEKKLVEKPIHMAAENGHSETVSALLDLFGANVNAKDSDGNTALHRVVLAPYATRLGRDMQDFYDTALVLVKHSIVVNELNVKGQTALHLASRNQFPMILQMLKNFESADVGFQGIVENEIECLSFERANDEQGVGTHHTISPSDVSRKTEDDVSIGDAGSKDYGTTGATEGTLTDTARIPASKKKTKGKKLSHQRDSKSGESLMKQRTPPASEDAQLCLQVTTLPSGSSLSLETAIDEDYVPDQSYIDERRFDRENKSKEGLKGSNSRKLSKIADSEKSRKVLLANKSGYEEKSKIVSYKSMSTPEALPSTLHTVTNLSSGQRQSATASQASSRSSRARLKLETDVDEAYQEYLTSSFDSEASSRIVEDILKKTEHIDKRLNKKIQKLSSKHGNEEQLGKNVDSSSEFPDNNVNRDDDLLQKDAVKRKKRENINSQNREIVDPEITYMKGESSKPGHSKSDKVHTNRGNKSEIKLKAAQELTEYELRSNLDISSNSNGITEKDIDQYGTDARKQHVNSLVKESLNSSDHQRPQLNKKGRQEGRPLKSINLVNDGKPSPFDQVQEVTVDQDSSKTSIGTSKAKPINKRNSQKRSSDDFASMKSRGKISKDLLEDGDAEECGLHNGKVESDYKAVRVQKKNKRLARNVETEELNYNIEKENINHNITISKKVARDVSLESRRNGSSAEQTSTTIINGTDTSNIDTPNLRGTPLRKWEELEDVELLEITSKSVIVQEREAENYLRLVMSPTGMLSDLETEMRALSRMRKRPFSPSRAQQDYLSYNKIHKYCCPHHGCRYKLLSYNTSEIGSLAERNLLTCPQESRITDKTLSAHRSPSSSAASAMRATSKPVSQKRAHSDRTRRRLRYGNDIGTSPELDEHRDCCPRFVNGGYEVVCDHSHHHHAISRSPNFRPIPLRNVFRPIPIKLESTPKSEHMLESPEIYSNEFDSSKPLIWERADGESTRRVRAHRHGSAERRAKQMSRRFTSAQDGYCTDEADVQCEECHLDSRGRHWESCSHYKSKIERDLNESSLINDSSEYFSGSRGPKVRKIQPMKYPKRRKMKKGDEKGAEDEVTMEVTSMQIDASLSISKSGSAFKPVVRSVRASSGRKTKSTSSSRNAKIYKKSYDPYDSHGEDDEECTHCKHRGGDHMTGKHADCCPRYVDNSLGIERVGSDEENDFELSRIGSSPRRRTIQPLPYPGAGGEMSIEQSQLGDELSAFAGDERSFDESLATAPHSELYDSRRPAIRAQGRTPRSRKSRRSVRRTYYKKSYDPYDSHGEDDEECTHCKHRGGDHMTGKHADCCPRYVDNSLGIERIGSDEENDFELSRIGSSPRRRTIQPLPFVAEETSHEGDLDDHIGALRHGRYDSRHSSLRARHGLRSRYGVRGEGEWEEEYGSYDSLYEREEEGMRTCLHCNHAYIRYQRDLSPRLIHASPSPTRDYMLQDFSSSTYNRSLNSSTFSRSKSVPSSQRRARRHSSKESQMFKSTADSIKSSKRTTEAQETASVKLNASKPDIRRSDAVPFEQVAISSIIGKTSEIKAKHRSDSTNQDSINVQGVYRPTTLSLPASTRQATGMSSMNNDAWLWEGYEGYELDESSDTDSQVNENKGDNTRHISSSVSNGRSVVRSDAPVIEDSSRDVRGKGSGRWSKHS